MELGQYIGKGFGRTLMGAWIETQSTGWNGKNHHVAPYGCVD